MRELAIETRPEGVFKRAAMGGVKPKFRIRVAEYVVITPEDIEIYGKCVALVSMAHIGKRIK